MAKRTKRPRITLPDRPTPEEIGILDRYLEDLDERSAVDRFAQRWRELSETERGEIRKWLQSNRQVTLFDKGADK